LLLVFDEADRILYRYDIAFAMIAAVIPLKQTALENRHIPEI